MVAGWTFAQKPIILPLQQHKLLYADTVHRKAVASKDSLMLAEAYYLYGKTYEAAGDLLTSQRWFLKSLAILEPRGDSFNLSRLYFRLSRNESRQRHYLETRHYAQLSLAVARRIRSTQALGRAYSAMADFYVIDWSNGGKKLGWPKSKLDSAHYYQKADEALIENDHKDFLVQLNRLSLIANRLWYEKSDPNGISYLQKALDLAEKEKEPTWQFRIMREMAGMYLSMNKPKPAWQWLRRTDQFLAQSPFANSQTDQDWLEKGYRDYYLQIGDWQRAYEHTEKIHELERNNYITDRDGAVTRLGLEYETEKKEAQLKAQQKELALRAENLLAQKRSMLAMSALLLVTAAMSVVFFRLYRKNQRISRQNAELVKEQNHRVKNNLQVVSSLLSLQSNRLDDETARTAVGESQMRVETMAILHRRLYDSDALAQVNLQEYIPELVDIVLQTYGNIHIQPLYDIELIELSADRALALGLLLNELTTNACKYAFPSHSDPVFRISCQHKNNQIKLCVADNGAGFAPPLLTDLSSKSQLSFGMRLIQMQVEQLRGSYQFTNSGGTLFTLKFNRL
ncbi:sensor histidine kinase [Spirosoma arboris]|nr:sensor histidine kinase [Spirosoma arboris]